MSAQQQSLGEWVERVNHDIFYQQNEEVFNKAVNEDIDSGLVVRLNHSVYNYEQFKGGLVHIRNTGYIVLHSVSEVAKWDDSEKRGGVVAHMTEFATKDNTTGKETRKTSLVVSAVKWIDGRRKITELTEVENE
ncbi:hypothetical protein B0J12DRAFT_730006 [Macrophomina phaseolina]|uniref:Uncharacterized protein n=1 Tax=Macrophomina phaseolina TaxID=35725 RepID=A0ABQ8G5F9_9PEZI|nr:hypothetical protein B0J12DRAFT_730006 [Macrophomina phaseolina]